MSIFNLQSFRAFNVRDSRPAFRAALGRGAEAIAAAAAPPRRQASPRPPKPKRKPCGRQRHEPILDVDVIAEGRVRAALAALARPACDADGEPLGCSFPGTVPP